MELYGVNMKDIDEKITENNHLSLPSEGDFHYKDGGMNMIFDLTNTQLRNKGAHMISYVTAFSLYWNYNFWLTAPWTAPFYGLTALSAMFMFGQFSYSLNRKSMVASITVLPNG